MRMRQSLAELEQQFVEEILTERDRRELLREHAAKRSRQRAVQREQKRSSLRFVALWLSIIATAVIVTIAMFETLYYVMG